MTTHLKGLLMTVFAVIILSPDSVLIRLVEDASPEVDSWTVLFWRGLLYAVGVSLLVFIKYRSKTIKEFQNIGKGGLLIGFFSGISTGTFVFAIVYTSIANALVIISTGPIMIAIVSWFLLKEKSSLITWASMIIVFIGIYIVMSGNFGGDKLVGDLFALATAVMMGFTFTLTRKYKTINMVPVNAIGGVIAAFIAFIMANKIAVPIEVFKYVLAMGTILSISFSLITIAPRYMPAAEVGMIMPLETVLGTLIAWYVINEEPTANALIGGSIVIVTLFLHSWYSSNLARKIEKI
ncbi:DMT family transporter [Candidatus Thioglobus sp. NP1]|jgi:drug/metabolite transporter (DMT)-like permease|uniref:DMT family transporter n=1 Tax=Candidatus Thioglobus sp. NP1 TaxID=2508687 RepID=UPI000DEDD66D|nr:DMT family transporter [Candidatus Thioglobus sp. NP1]AXE61992.1 EamA family transporter [Candidatus Thioglobus sp. NP1]|tara:strand:+ start:3693 stop:4574 length:882 start_codon:yes stop_codon:yes gene_type:complete